MNAAATRTASSCGVIGAAFACAFSCGFCGFCGFFRDSRVDGAGDSWAFRDFRVDFDDIFYSLVKKYRFGKTPTGITIADRTVCAGDLLVV